MHYTISVKNVSETLLFSASELCRYLRLCSVNPLTTEISAGAVANPLCIQVGLFSDFPDCPKIEASSPWTDSLRINIKNGSGTIAGSNARSVLIAVYRFFHQIGCRWVRPGADGESLVQTDFTSLCMDVQETASYPHRGICIEGACSITHVLDIIDWSPKAGFSAFFMQFPEGHIFFRHWYSHHSNTELEAETVSKSAARRYTIQAEIELKKRGMLYHGMGHGWTCRAIDVDISHWEPHSADLRSNRGSEIAQLSGSRNFLWDRPMITSLCFSKESIRKKIILDIADYAQEHPEVELLHVWLDDGGHNKCECAECSTKVPAEWYLLMLLDLEKLLDQRNCTTKIAAISYSDLLWLPDTPMPPLNPERFVLITAYQRASYLTQINTGKTSAPVPAYKRNQYSLAGTPEELQAFLCSWQKYFIGQHLIYEYHLFSAPAVFNQILITKVIQNDISELNNLHLLGYMSCQSLRCFFPTGLPVYMLGQCLWNTHLDYTAVLNDYFYASFGSDGAMCKEFLILTGEELIKIFRIEDGTMVLKSNCGRSLTRIDTLVKEMEKTLIENVSLENRCHARSWKIIQWYCSMLAQFNYTMGCIIKFWHDDPATEWEQLRLWLCQHEMEVQEVFDLWAFLHIFDPIFTNGKYKIETE